MKLLIVNDDGVHAPGLEALHNAVADLADVMVVAPDREQSGVSHAISLATPVRTHRIRGKKDHFAVTGTPVDCTLVGLFGLSETRPDMVLSGINLGGNLGSDVLYSGTVQAAAEAAIHGIPAVAFSLAYRGGFDFTFATMLARKLVIALTKSPVWFSPALREAQGAPLLNVNIPYTPDAPDPATMRITRLGRRRYGGEVVARRHDPHGLPYYWTTASFSGFEPIPGSDCEANEQNIVSLTPLSLDWTRRSIMDFAGSLTLDGISVELDNAAMQ